MHTHMHIYAHPKASFVSSAQAGHEDAPWADSPLSLMAGLKHSIS